MRNRATFSSNVVTWLILFVILMVPLSKASAASTVSLWADNFQDFELHERWFWVRETLGWSLVDNFGWLTIYAQESGNLPENLLLQKAPDSDFIIQTFVVFTPTADYQQAGLLLYLDDEHYLTLGRAYCTPGDDCVGNGIYFDHVDGGSFIGSNFATTTTAANFAYLRIIKNGNTFTGYYSEDKAVWTLIGSHTPEFTPDSFGLTVRKGIGTAPNFDARFANFFIFSRVWQDDFAQTTLDDRWAWVREDSGKWSLTANPGAMRITTQQGGLLGAGGDAKNLLLQEVPIGDYTLETHLKFKPLEDFNFAGLLIYLDDDHFLALGRAYCTPGDDCVGNGIYFDHESSGKTRGGNFAMATIVKNEAYLRIVKTHNTYTGYYSADGQSWTKVGSHSITFTPDRVGVIAQSSAASTAAISADFNYFKLRSDVPADLFLSSTLGADWSWIREDPSHWSLAAYPGLMRITTQDGSLYGAGGDTPNLLLQPTPMGDFAVETAVYFSPSENYHNAGLLIYLDDDNYLKLTRAFCDQPPNCVGNAVYFDHEADGAVVGSNFATVTVGINPTYLRIIRIGGTYTAYTSSTSGNWTMVGSHTPEFTPTHIGFVSGSSNTGASEIPADFSYFALDDRTDHLFLPLIWH